MAAAILVLSTVPIIEVNAVSIFTNGFETGNFSAWTAEYEDTVINSSVRHHGSYSAMDNGTDQGFVSYATGFSETTLYSRAYYRFVGLNETNWINHEIMMNLGTAVISMLYITKLNGPVNEFVWKIEGINASSTVTNQSALGVSIDPTHWYCLEVKTVVHAAAGEVRLYVDGSETLVITGLNTTTYGDLVNVFFGLCATDGSGAVDVINFDCCAIADAYIGTEGSISAPAGVFYAMPYYGTYLSFEDDQTFQSAYREDDANATYPAMWFFDDYGIASTVNITINDYFSDKMLNVTFSAAGTLYIYCGSLGTPTAGDTFTYNAATQIATVTDSGTVVLGWKTYTVSLTKAEGVVLQGDLVHFSIPVTADTVAYSSFLANVTKDDATFLENITSFTDTEPNAQAHTYRVSNLYDTALGTNVTYTVPVLTVTWAGGGGGGGGGGGPTPTPSPTTEPTPTQTPIFSPSEDYSGIFLIALAAFLAIVLIAKFSTSNKSVWSPTKRKRGKPWNPPKRRTRKIQGYSHR